MREEQKKECGNDEKANDGDRRQKIRRTSGMKPCMREEREKKPFEQGARSFTASYILNVLMEQL